MKAKEITITGTHRGQAAAATFTALEDGGWRADLVLGDRTHSEVFPKRFHLRPCPSVASDLFDQMLGEGRYRTSHPRPRVSKVATPLRVHQGDA